MVLGRSTALVQNNETFYHWLCSLTSFKRPFSTGQWGVNHVWCCHTVMQHTPYDIQTILLWLAWFYYIKIALGIREMHIQLKKLHTRWIMSVRCNILQCKDERHWHFQAMYNVVNYISFWSFSVVCQCIVDILSKVIRFDVCNVFVCVYIPTYMRNASLELRQ